MRIVMMGTGTFAEPAFQKLIDAFPGEVVGLVTQPEREVGRRSGSSRQTGIGMSSIAKAHSIPVIQPESINSDEGIALLAALQPDLCVVAAYGQIFKATVLGVPRLGFVNLHASLLPKYRGAAPVAHAILNGETETGVTIFRITTGIDTGEMLAKVSTPIGDMETTGELETRLAALGAELIVDVVKKMHDGPLPGEKQDATLASKAPKITKEMGLIDWAVSGIRIENHIRAMQPWPTAFSFLHRAGHEPLRISIQKLDAFQSHMDISWDIWPQEGVINNNTPWESSLVVGAASEYVKILQLQPAGRKSMSAAEFLRGYPLPKGSRFGPERLP